MQFNEPILCLCNYGQVRSVTMATILQDKGYQTLAAGMISTPPPYLDKMMEKAGTVIICNKPNVDRRFDKDTDKERAENIISILDKYKDKTIICDTVGFDRWGKPMHPELFERCELFLRNVGRKYKNDLEKRVADLIYEWDLDNIKKKYHNRGE